MAFDPEKTLVIIFGASQWPKVPSLRDSPSDVFENSAGGMKDYLLKNLSIQEENLIDLFDYPNHPTELTLKIKKAIDEKTSDNQRIDLFFYYVGHGAKLLQEYYLYLRNSYEGITSSCFNLGDLVTAISERASKIRYCYFILDACQSQTAYNYLKNIKKVKAVLLSSSSQQEFSMAGMFTDALLEVLNRPHEKPWSFCELHQEIVDFLKETHKDDAVRPKIDAINDKRGEAKAIDEEIFPSFPKGTVRRNPLLKVNNMTLLHYLPNRKDQEIKLGRAIRSHSNHQRPLICLIYGEAQECSDMFMKCLEQGNLAKLVPQQLQEGLKSCPFDCDIFHSVNQLHEKMLASLGEQLCNHILASKEDIAQAIMREQRLVILSTNFCHQDWQREGVKMIHGFLDFWEDWPNLVNQKHLILVCVTVNYQTDAKTSLLRRLFKTSSPHQEIRDAFANLEKNLNRPNVNVVVLPELVSVEQQQVENWARVHAQKCCDNVDEILLKIQELFKKRATQRMAMQPLAVELKKMLRECQLAKL